MTESKVMCCGCGEQEAEFTNDISEHFCSMCWEMEPASSKADELLRSIFEKKMKELGHAEVSFVQDDYGYMMMDIAIQYSGFKMGYLAAKGKI